ncbi:MAG: serine hydrolase domain-containing protein [Parasphingorhabdus sp.]|uniref:serine hydrolase domain-containing protein n=1 Tax=Parasphingorhabdus sp. TaxID=2709688 RepID=UPI00329891C3
MDPMRRSIGIGFSALTALLLTACQHIGQTTASTSWQDRPASAESAYLERFAAVAKAGGYLSYDILKPVQGADARFMTKSDQDSSPISKSAIEKVMNYAGATNSSALLIWHDGELVAERYFGDTKVDSALVSKSLAKPLSAIAIGRAIKMGDIASLDQSASDFITEWRGTPKAKMTIRHVLAMQTGFLEQAFAPGPDNHWARAYMDPYHERYLIHEYPLTDEPGSTYSYSNAAADLIAIIIARATEQSYDEFIGKQVLAPIGAVGGTIWLNRANGFPHSGCCINLPAQSWLKLAILLSENGRVGAEQILPQNFVAEMRKPSVHNLYYGLGVWLGQPYAERRGFMGPKSSAPKVLHSAPYLADDLFLFDGNGNQVAYIIPSEKMVILRLGSSPPKSVVWDNSFLPNTILSEF